MAKAALQTIVGLLILLAAQISTACDTPVYRYAMYRWTPAPYEIYYFHDQPLDENARQMQQKFAALGEDRENSANIAFMPVDLNKDPGLRAVPRDVIEHWIWHPQRATGTYMIVTPSGEQMHYGGLSPESLASITDSPARTKVSKQLELGKAAVFVLLTGKDKSANEQSEQLLAKLVKDVDDGKIQLYSTPEDEFAPLPKGDKEDDEPKKAEHTISYLKVDRTDAKERWLVDMLLSVEGDLREEQFEDTPMVFAVYGRARALPPYIGRGITRDNLIDCVTFVTGACSCTVKEQNPGVDLLVRFDWESAADKVAELFGAEEGNETFGPDEFFPEIIVGGSNTVDNPAKIDTPVAVGPDRDPSVVDPPVDTPEKRGEPVSVAGPQDDPAEGTDGGDEPKVTQPVDDGAEGKFAGGDEKKPTDDPQASDNAPPKPTGDKADPESQAKNDTQVALASTPDSDATPDASSDADESTGSIFTTVAVGVGVALFGLIAATFLFLRPRR